MGRPPIGKKAMTAAERQRRLRAKLRPFDADKMALGLANKIASDEHYVALIAAMVVGLGRDFVTTHTTEGFEHTVTVSVTERKLTRKAAGRRRR